MEFNNNNSFNPNMNPYFTPTPFDSDNFNLTFYNMNQPNTPGWTYLNQYNPCPKLMTIIFEIISTLHRVNGDSTSPSQIFNHLVYNFHNIHSLISLPILFSRTTNWSELEKSIKVNLQKVKRQFQKIMASQFHNIFKSLTQFHLFKMIIHLSWNWLQNSCVSLSDNLKTCWTYTLHNIFKTKIPTLFF